MSEHVCAQVGMHVSTLVDVCSVNGLTAPPRLPLPMSQQPKGASPRIADSLTLTLDLVSISVGRKISNV